MAGYWELWDLDTANALADFETKSEALAFVRELMCVGWRCEELSLHFDDPALDADALSPALTREQLARRAETAGPDPVRRTA